ncbi:MAG: hypothetical protein ACKPKO_20365, partial [Candidatus Fonsibacter sp.]
KYANLSNMLQPGLSILSDQFTKASNKLLQVEEVVQSYNKAVAPLASNQNMMFRQNDIEPNARATEYARSTHKRTDIAGKSHGRKDRRRGYACAHILLCELY